jgi:hypothetical protein
MKLDHHGPGSSGIVACGEAHRHLAQLQRWTSGATRSPVEKIKRERRRELLATLFDVDSERAHESTVRLGGSAFQFIPSAFRRIAAAAGNSFFALQQKTPSATFSGVQPSVVLTFTSAP